MAVRFAFDITDRASGPVNKIAGALAGFEKRMRSVNLTTGKGEEALGTIKSKVEEAFGKKAADTLGRFASGQLNAADKIALVKKGAEVQFSILSKGFGMIRSGATAAVKALGAVGAAVLGATAFGGKLLLDAVRFKEATGHALKFTQGTAQAANSTMADVGRIANLLGASTEWALDKFGELNAKGFDDRESKILLQFAADLKAYNKGQEVSVDAIAEPLKALKTGGMLNVDSFKALESASLSRAQLNERLAQQLGVNVAGMNQDRSTMVLNQALAKIPRGQQAVNKLMELTLSAMGQKALGEGAQDFQLKTVGGLLDTIQNRWGNLLKLVNTEGPGSGLVRILGRFAAALDPTTKEGQKLLATFDKIATVAGEALDNFDPDDVVSGLMEISSAIDRVLGPLKTIGGSALQGFREAKATVLEMRDAFGGANSSMMPTTETLKTIGKALGYFVVGVGAAIAGIVWLEVKLAQLAVAIFKPAVGLGLAIIEGIATGLGKAKAALVSKLEELTALLPDSVRKLLKIQSPSRVFMQIGAHTAEGLAAGIEGGERRVEQSAEALAVSAVRGGAQPTGQDGGQRPTVNLPPGLVQVTVTGAGDLDEIERRVQEGILRAFREMGFELGVTAALWASLSSSRAPAPSSTRRGSARIGTRPSSTAPRCPGS